MSCSSVKGKKCTCVNCKQQRAMDNLMNGIRILIQNAMTTTRLKHADILLGEYEATEAVVIAVINGLYNGINPKNSDDIVDFNHHIKLNADFLKNLKVAEIQTRKDLH